MLNPGKWNVGMGGFGEVLPYHENRMYLNYDKDDDKMGIQFKNLKQESKDFPKEFENNQLNEKWSELNKIRDICNISIEEKRASKEIGSSLEASLEIELDKKGLDLIKGIDLSEICITSSVKIKKEPSEKIYVETNKAKGNKCSLCWKIKLEACGRSSCPI